MSSAAAEAIFRKRRENNVQRARSRLCAQERQTVQAGLNYANVEDDEGVADIIQTDCVSFPFRSSKRHFPSLASRGRPCQTG